MRPRPHHDTDDSDARYHGRRTAHPGATRTHESPDPVRCPKCNLYLIAILTAAGPTWLCGCNKKEEN